MIIDLLHNKIVKDTLTQEFEKSVNDVLVPMLLERYGDGLSLVLMYEDYVADNFFKGGRWYYPFTVTVDGATFSEWVSWDVSDKKQYKNASPYSYSGKAPLDFVLEGSIALEFQSRIYGRSIDYYPNLIPLKVSAATDNTLLLSGNYSQSFVDEMAYQLTYRLSKILGVSGLENSGIMLELVFAPGTYMEHTSENVTYRRLIMIEKSCQPRDFWVKWTRKNSAVGFSVKDHVRRDDIIFDLGEDVPQKIREKEFRFLCNSNPDKYQSAMGKKTVTEWRDIIKRALKRGDITKLPDEFDVAPETAKAVGELGALAGVSAVANDADIPSDDSFASVMDMAKAALEALEERSASDKDESINDYDTDGGAQLKDAELDAEDAESDDELTEGTDTESESLDIPFEFSLDDVIDAELTDDDSYITDGGLFEEPDGGFSLEFSETESFDEQSDEGDFISFGEQLQLDGIDEENADEAKEVEQTEKTEESEEIEEAEESEDEIEFPITLDTDVSDIPEGVSYPVDGDKLTSDSIAQGLKSFTAEASYSESRIDAEVIRSEIEEELRALIECELKQKYAAQIEELNSDIETLRDDNTKLRQLLASFETVRAKDRSEANSRIDALLSENAELKSRLEKVDREEARERDRLAEAARLAVEEQRRKEREDEEHALRLEAEREREREREEEEKRRLEKERIRREAEARVAVAPLLPKVDTTHAENYISKRATIIFRNPVDLNVIKLIREIVEQTIIKYGKQHVPMHIKAYPKDQSTINLDVLKMPASEKELLIEVIKAIGNGGLGITKITLE